MGDLLSPEGVCCVYCLQVLLVCCNKGSAGRPASIMFHSSIFDRRRIICTPI
jgi:hypothetical protein